MSTTPPRGIKVKEQINQEHRRLGEMLDPLMEHLLSDVGASRTTVRIDIPDWDISVNDVIAEARAPEVRSLRGETSIDQRAQPTVAFLDSRREPLVQNEFRSTAYPPPPALISLYDVKAQMLAPLIVDDELAGWISVHYTPAERDWTQDDVDTLKHAQAAVIDMLEQESAPARPA